MRSATLELVEQFIDDRQGLPEEVEVEAQENESLPEFPRLPGPLGKLVEAITPDIPYEHKALAALTYVGVALSGRVRIKSEPFLQPRFYACSVGLAGTGKSAADKEVARAILHLIPNVNAVLSLDSGPGLVEILAEKPRTLYRPDEMADAFEKAKLTTGSRNSLFGEFLRLYESGETGNAVIKKNGGCTSVENAHFAICGSATTDRFERIWAGSGAASGLQSRFVLSYSEQMMPSIKNENNETMLAEAQADLSFILGRDDVQYIGLSEDAQNEIIWWEMSVDRGKHTRVLDMAKRFALIVAATCGESTITGDTMKLGLRFADYQLALYQKLMPDDAATFVQAMENKILRFYEKHAGTTERQCRNWIKPEKCPGGFGAFNQALANLKRANALVSVGSSRKGAPLWSRER